MSVRETHAPYDIKDCFYALLNQFVSDGSPWSSWQIVRGFPDTDLCIAESKNYVYIDTVLRAGELKQQGGKPRNIWNLTIGFWVSRDKGGEDEMEIWIGAMLYKFQDRTVHSKQFTVTLGTTEYADTTFLAQGIVVRSIDGPGPEIENDTSNSENRREMNLILIA